MALPNCKRGMTIARRLPQERERGKDCGGNQSLHVDRLRLSAKPRNFQSVGNRLLTSIEVALTARRELHSSSIPRLEISQGAEKEWNENRQPPHRLHPE